MTPDPIGHPTARKPIRLWPGVVIVILLCLIRFVVPAVVPGAHVLGMLGGLAGGVLVILWWVFFSRAPWLERLGAVALIAVAMVATRRILHESIASGMMGMMFYILAPPFLGLAFVAWAVATRHRPDGARRVSMVATVLLACGAWALFRTGGITGEADSDFHWRFTQTPEERLLAGSLEAPEAPAAGAGETQTEAEWPGFRGPERDGVVRGARIDTDWAVAPPVELWRRPIGPGWSSFAVRGDVFYTQEQRGDDEVVSCYRLASGEPVWRHADAARFWESNGGAGPRATPTLSDGRVYTLGATGIVNALEAGDGAVVWSRNAAADTERKTPGWGFASSPLVVHDLVVIATAGVLVAYDAATGDRRWVGETRGFGYSSPHRMTLDGVDQILLLDGLGAVGVAPAEGKLLWEHRWQGDGIVQPARTADGDVLIGTGSGLGSGAGIGVRRLAVAQGASGWTVEERWTSTGLKPYFNDFVVHEGYAFGFDGGILSCIDLADGRRRWKGGRYGHGQMVLLADQGLLLVLSEKGELALVGATPSGFTELARFKAIEGKTWNHPVLVGDVLLVRNDQEMAAFRLSRASG